MGTGSGYPETMNPTQLMRPGRRVAARLCTLVVVAGTSALAACDRNPNRPGTTEAVFRVSACSTQTFNIRLTDPQLIQQAQGLIGQAQQRIVTGRLAPGDGGFNQPWSWYLLPETVQFADVTIELCDGCPRMVEDDLGYWIDTVGQFCPWSSRIVARVR